MQEFRHICKRWDAEDTCTICHKVKGKKYAKYRSSYVHKLPEPKTRPVVVPVVARREVVRKIFCAVCKDEITLEQEVVFMDRKEVHVHCKPAKKTRRKWDGPLVRLSACKQCGKELGPYKYYYCSNRCSWRYNAQKHGIKRDCVVN